MISQSLSVMFSISYMLIFNFFLYNLNCLLNVLPCPHEQLQLKLSTKFLNKAKISCDNPSRKDLQGRRKWTVRTLFL